VDRVAGQKLPPVILFMHWHREAGEGKAVRPPVATRLFSTTSDPEDIKGTVEI
jgi:hypothetical protein